MSKFNSRFSHLRINIGNEELRNTAEKPKTNLFRDANTYRIQSPKNISTLTNRPVQIIYTSPLTTEKNEHKKASHANITYTAQNMKNFNAVNNLNSNSVNRNAIVNNNFSSMTPSYGRNLTDKLEFSAKVGKPTLLQVIKSNLKAKNLHNGNNNQENTNNFFNNNTFNNHVNHSNSNNLNNNKSSNNSNLVSSSNRNSLNKNSSVNVANSKLAGSGNKGGSNQVNNNSNYVHNYPFSKSNSVSKDNKQQNNYNPSSAFNYDLNFHKNFSNNNANDKIPNSVTHKILQSNNLNQVLNNNNTSKIPVIKSNSNILNTENNRSDHIENSKGNSNSGNGYLLSEGNINNRNHLNHRNNSHNVFSVINNLNNNTPNVNRIDNNKSLLPLAANPLSAKRENIINYNNFIKSERGIKSLSPNIRLESHFASEQKKKLQSKNSEKIFNTNNLQLNKNYNGKVHNNNVTTDNYNKQSIPSSYNHTENMDKSSNIDSNPEGDDNDEAYNERVVHTDVNTMNNYTARKSNKPELIDIMKLISANQPPISLNVLNKKFENFENSKYSTKPLRYIKAYSANTHQGTVR